MLKNLVIIGAGGCGREVLQWAKHINAINPKWEIKGFLEYDEHALDGKGHDIGICGNDDTYEIKEEDEFICAIGDSGLREKVANKLMERGARFTNIIHPTAIVAETSRLGNGVVIYPFSIISDNAVVGDGTIINSHTTIGHDSHVGGYSTISAHCDITGMCDVGERVFMGTSSHLVPRSVIGNDVFICAGSTVMSRLRDHVKVMGNPAKMIKF